MTYGIRNLVGIRASAKDPDPKREGYFGTRKSPLGDWGTIGNTIYTYAWGCHTGHTLEFLVALCCYWLLYSDGTIMEEAKTFQMGWVGKILAFNLACEVIFFGFWHYVTYVSRFALSLAPFKYNPENQYEPGKQQARMLTSTTGNLQREMFYTTLGWLQSTASQCVLTWAWASGRLPYYLDFWRNPWYSVLLLMGVTYWREVHFYFVHRMIHPWWDRRNGLLDGDLGAFLYRHVHSLHHKSYNPGPWSGLSMHPVEHLFYYSCATLPPLLITVHPLHFLYCKFHCDIAPIGGHDGLDAPGGGGDFHWLHHAKFECNYGVPFPFNFDKLFGTFVDYEEYKRTGQITASEKCARLMHDPDNSELDAALLPQPGPSEDRVFQVEEVAKHNTRSDCWIIVNGRVLNVTDFISKHPGGEMAIMIYAGKDASTEFNSIHPKGVIEKNAPEAVIGAVQGGAAPAVAEEAEAPMGCATTMLMVLLVCWGFCFVAAFGRGTAGF
mmetsp:Transcript_48034/g.104476  ORF Transcript_48034/g.104476 Transcript_48034/m.104476 type:complete len:495 (-) Transcript_48034:118-1602(-)